jgi:uncharacterized protein (UPF0248 family)
MIPIQDLLSRIRWDPEFGQAQFVVGYYDRVEDRLVQVNLRDLRFSDEDRFAVWIADLDGQLRQVPVHRIREVRRDGALIWHRPL